MNLKIQQAGKLVEKDYQEAINNVDISVKKLKEEKKRYEDLVTISEDGDVLNVNQIEKYELETLYVRLGNHATKQGVVLQMDILEGSNNVKDHYNLKFTATGSYISITDFISAIENDTILGFKIEEFKMLPNTVEEKTNKNNAVNTGNVLKGTFICKNIAIKEISEITRLTNQTNTNNNQANVTNPSKITN